MAGHGEKLSRKQSAAIGALLSEPTVTAAAQVVGIGEATLRRWLKQPEFLGAYRTAQQEILVGTLTLLQKASDKAVETLLDSLQAKSEAVRLRAACAILDYAMNGAALLEREGRSLEALDRSLG